MIVRQKRISAGAGWSRRHFLQRAALAAGVATIGFPGLLRARGVNEKLNIGVIGLGNKGGALLKEISSCDVTVAALCDVDENQFLAAKKILPGKTLPPKTFVDYRELLQAGLDAVVIATPDHWHAPIATAALQAGRHVYCEKPLTRTISEARALARLAKQSFQLITQMGNQGSAAANLRRGIELIQGGVIGPVREVHVWVPPSGSFKAGQTCPTGEDPIPAGLHWNHWLGPAEFRSYQTRIYHPKAWRAWFDFGGGSMADWGCHGLNLPVRALKLDYPIQVEADVPGGLTAGYPKNVRVRFDFAARPDQPPVTLWWYDGGRLPPRQVLPKPIMDHFEAMPAGGVLLLGDRGFTFGTPHTGADYIHLTGEGKVSGILNHAATKSIATSLPHSPGHLQEWVNACGGGPATFSSFEAGGYLTEIALSGVVALRTQKRLDWNGAAMCATNAPEAEKFIQAQYRNDWKL